MRYMYTMEYYSAIEKNDILPFAATQMDVEGTMLSEIRQTKTVWYHLHEESEQYNRVLVKITKKRSRLTDTEDKLVLTRGGEI